MIRTLQFEELDSTQEYPKTHLKDLNVNELTVISARRQTRGKGRFNHSWKTGEGNNLAASFVSFHPKPFAYLHNFAQLLALTACELLDVESTLKWPNDLLVEGKKLAGVVTEIHSVDESWMVVNGLGINVHMSEEELSQLDNQATSLSRETGKNYDIEGLLHSLSEEYEKNLRLFSKEGFSPFLKRFEKKLCHAPGERVQFHVQGELVSGEFDLITPKGLIQLRLEEGQLKTFS